MTLRIASFGIRGHVGTSLSPRMAQDFSSAFATYLDGGRVVVGRDTRYSSPMLHAAVLSSLLSAGCEVLDFGVCPTPVLQYAVRVHGAAGGISISGGHNGMGWNALTLLGQDGSYLEPTGGETVLDFFHAGDYLHRDAQHMGHVQVVDDVIDGYFGALCKALDVDVIRKAKWTVLIDPVAGAGCGYLAPFAERLGFNLVGINAQPSGYLPRDPEPRPRTAAQMAGFIGHVRGDVGFVLSSDLGRLSIVTETGEPASEEYTFPLIANHVLGRRKGTVVTNCCTSRMVDDLAREHGVPLVKTPVGQAYVMSALADTAGVIGGEGSGSAAIPQFSRAFDGFLMMGLILEAMAVSGKRLSELLRGLPKYHMVKRRVSCGSRQAYSALEALKHNLVRQYAEHVNLTDGLRIDWDDGWVHIRPSRTEQLLRVISEAATKDVAEHRAEDMVRMADRAL
jgi:phosphomannomutase